MVKRAWKFLADSGRSAGRTCVEDPRLEYLLSSGSSDRSFSLLYVSLQSIIPITTQVLGLDTYLGSIYASDMF